MYYTNPNIAVNNVNKNVEVDIWEFLNSKMFLTDKDLGDLQDRLTKKEYNELIKLLRNNN